MLEIRRLGAILYCNKCGRIIRKGFEMATYEALERLLKKRRYCGHCIQERLNRKETK